ncbi:hypothetical protein ACJZ2D_014394 [Fusarium nematophilum]
MDTSPVSRRRPKGRRKVIKSKAVDKPDFDIRPKSLEVELFDARRHQNSANSAHDQASQYNNGGDITLNRRNYATNIFINSMLWPQYSKQQDTAEERVLMDISGILSQFSSETRALISGVRDSLDAIQGHHSDAKKLLKEAAKNKALAPAGTEAMGRMERMGRKLTGQKSLAMFTGEQFLLLGTFVDTSSGGQQPNPNSQRAKELLQTLKRARQKLREACQLLRRLVLIRQTSKKVVPTDLTSRVHRCSDNIRAGVRLLKDFQALSQDCIKELWQTGQQLLNLDNEEAKDLDRLTACRNVSTVLCRQLSQLCDEHDEHYVYVNLEKIEPIQQNAKKRVRFHLAFERPDQNRDGYVWIQAQSIIHDNATGTPSFSRQTESTPSPHPSPNRYISVAETTERPCFCLASLENGMNFKFKIGSSTHVQQRPPPSGEGTSPTSLSEWIKERYQPQWTRIRMARLISEAVLRFDLALWDPASLMSKNIMLIRYKTSEAQLSVCLRLQRLGFGMSSPAVPRTNGARHIRTALFHLGVILLELACLEEGAKEDILQRRKCGPDDLKDMGDYYAAVVKYCVQRDDPDGDVDMDGSGADIYDEQYFYQHVIRLLKMEDELMGGYGEKMSD